MSEGREIYPFPELKWSRANNPLGETIAYALGKTTKESRLPESDGSKRPLSLRNERAMIYEEIMKTSDRVEKKRLIEEAHDWDNVFVEFSNNRKMVDVDLGNLGVQSAECTEIKFKKTDLSKPPIVLIPGISNDLDGVGQFPLKLALESKRRVVMFTYPESWHGRVTSEFADAIEKSENFKPHVDFFKGAINKLIEDDQFDMVGISAGAIMVTELIKDEELKTKINGMNLIVPPGLVNMNVKNIIKGIGRELKGAFLNNGSMLKISVLNREKIMKSKVDVENAKRASGNLFNKLNKRYEWWKADLTSIKGLKTEVIICGNDGVTHGRDGVKELQENPSLNVVYIPKGSHDTVGSNSHQITKKMDFN